MGYREQMHMRLRQQMRYIVDEAENSANNSKLIEVAIVLKSSNTIWLTTCIQ